CRTVHTAPGSDLASDFFKGDHPDHSQRIGLRDRATHCGALARQGRARKTAFLAALAAGARPTAERSTTLDACGTADRRAAGSARCASDHAARAGRTRAGARIGAEVVRRTASEPAYLRRGTARAQLRETDALRARPAAHSVATGISEPAA